MPKIVEDEKIYHAILQTVIERGYAGATTRQMADAAGVSEVTLFRKYGNKLRLVKQAISAFIAQTEFVSAARYTGDVYADLMRVVQTYQEAGEKNGQIFSILLSEMPRYPELAESLDAPLGIIRSIGQLLARYQAEGLLRQEHPLHAVAGLLGPLNITAVMRGAMPQGSLPTPDLPNHVVYFLEGRRIRSADP